MVWFSDAFFYSSSREACRTDFVQIEKELLIETRSKKLASSHEVSSGSQNIHYMVTRGDRDYILGVYFTFTNYLLRISPLFSVSVASTDNETVKQEIARTRTIVDKFISSKVEREGKTLVEATVSA